MRLTLPLGSAKGGLNYDLPAETLDIEALTDVKNLRFVDGKLQRVGFQKTLTSLGTTPGSWIGSMQIGNSYLWTIATDINLYALYANTLTDISRTASAYTTGGVWTGTILNGIPVFTNGIDVPQAWMSASVSTPVVDLANWPATDTAKIVRSFYTVLIAMDMTVSGNEYPYRLKTSQPADPGSVPSSWDETDATKNVLLVDVADTPDLIVDGQPMRDVFVIYKQQSIWLLEPTGGSGLVPSLFRIANASREIGLLSRECVASIQDRHFIVGNDDCGLFDGQQFKSMMDKRLRKWFFNELSTSHYDQTFVYKDLNNREIVICLTPKGASSPQISLAWNWQTEQWSNRDLAGLNFISFGGQHSGTDTETWDSHTGAWDENVAPWTPITNPRAYQVVLGVTDSEVILLDSTEPNSSETSKAYVERLDWPFGQIGRSGQVFPTYQYIKMFKTIYPRITAPAGTLFVLEYGTRDDLDHDVVWKPAKTFDPRRTKRVDLWARGRYLSYRLSCTTPVGWSLDGLDVELELRGKR